MGLPVTVAVVGTGSRGYTFAGYAERYPEQVRVVAVADPRADRRDVLADRHAVPPERRYADWGELAAGPRVADAVIVATPDREHVAPARHFAGQGYHVLLEKPIAPTREECVALVEAVESTGVAFAVCHVCATPPTATPSARSCATDGSARWSASTTWSRSAGGTSPTRSYAATGGGPTPPGRAC